MSQANTERSFNVLALLLASSRPVEFGQIVREIPGYPPDPEAARRLFSRDKQVLREMGVTLLSGAGVPARNAAVGRDGRDAFDGAATCAL